MSALGPAADTPAEYLYSGVPPAAVAAGDQNSPPVFRSRPPVGSVDKL